MNDSAFRVSSRAVFFLKFLFDTGVPADFTKVEELSGSASELRSLGFRNGRDADPAGGCSPDKREEGKRARIGPRQ